MGFAASLVELLASRLTITFAGEDAIDEGGVTRDWFDSVAKALVQGADDLIGTSLFILAPDSTLTPRSAKGSNREEKLRMIFAVGKFLAFAVLRQQPLPLSFNLVACKHLLGVPVDMDDVRRLDPDFCRH